MPCSQNDKNKKKPFLNLLTERQRATERQRDRETERQREGKREREREREAKVIGYFSTISKPYITIENTFISQFTKLFPCLCI